jgi:uncharacterized protein (DUF433 family)
MTAIDDARTALDAAHQHVGKATATLYAAHQGAEAIATQAASLGFTGVANNVLGLRQQIENVHHGLAVIDGQAVKAHDILNSVTAHATPEEVADALAVAHEQVNDMISHASHTLGEIDSLIAETHAALHGGKPDRMVSLLTDAKTHLTTVAQQSTVAGTKTQETHGAATTIGDF